MTIRPLSQARIISLSRLLRSGELDQVFRNRFVVLRFGILVLCQAIVSANAFGQQFPDYPLPSVLVSPSKDGGVFLEVMEIRRETLFHDGARGKVFDDLRFLYLLSIGDVRKDLKLTVRQESDVRDAYENLQREMQYHVIDVSNSDQSNAKLEAVYARPADKLREVLDDNQKNRMKQLQVQAMAVSKELGKIISDPLWNAIGVELNEKESNVLKDRLSEIEVKLNREITLARQRAFEEFIDSLPPSERAKVKKAIGDPIEGALVKPAMSNQ